MAGWDRVAAAAERRASVALVDGPAVLTVGRLVRDAAGRYWLRPVDNSADWVVLPDGSARLLDVAAGGAEVLRGVVVE